jgi:hypothetical protein
VAWAKYGKAPPSGFSRPTSRWRSARDKRLDRIVAIKTSKAPFNERFAYGATATPKRARRGGKTLDTSQGEAYWPPHQCSTLPGRTIDGGQESGGMRNGSYKKVVCDSQMQDFTMSIALG